MIWVLSDKASTLYVEFQQDGEFVIPDAGSVFLTLRGNSGVVLSGYDNLTVTGPILSTLSISLPPEVNTVSSGDFENRYVRVDFKVGNKPLYVQQVYRVGPFLPLACEPEDVRSLFGVRALELPDRDIDLRGAYYLLKDDYPEAMASSLTSASTSWAANRAVVLMAGLQLLPSMPVRALKEEGLNNATRIRATIDWEALEGKIKAELGVTMDKLETAASVGTAGLPTPIFVLSLPTDPVTNA